MKATTQLVAVAVLGLVACGKPAATSSSVAETTVGGPMIHELTAADGTVINIMADRVSSIDDGLSANISAANIHIQLSNPAFPGNALVRVVLIDVCADAAEPSDPYRSALQADATFADGAYHAAPAPGPEGLVMYSSTAGGTTTNCTQELATVVDGTWLTDPVNGTHNFKFSF